ncbi:DMT family transporter [Phaeobacter italicus]|jgi:drug/metabolite transporter (DMT)-like permease|uniref:DMT family transporter n=1 Tax=Phaeobacter italicus TaxID=481446 RepID=UPI000186FEFE|nr:DMT family transporter [Phaeobacter italicus]EEB69692.1 integral membrane protein [Ruegeria sp. R11]MBO9442432.1 DMT family transporter [Phaeobacter italicus]MBY5977351.1 DMT family transporter [Phaeobacter italicus]
MSPYYRGHLAMLLFSALVAGSFSLGSMVANDIAPMALNAIRFVIAGVVIGVAAHLTHGLRPAHFRAPWRFAVLGGLFAVYFVLMFYGLQTAPPVSAAAVFTLTPVLSAVFGFLLLRQITTLPMALALAIGGAGAIWVIFRGDLSAMRAFEVGQGEITYFWGCVAHAIYTPMVRRLNRGEPAVVFTFGTLVAGAIILTLFGWQDIRATDWASLSSLVWIAILYVAVFASAATFVLLQYASLHLPSAKVMAYTYLTPSWVILWEIALGKGVPDVIVLLGIALSVLALVMLLEGRARTSKA